ncbi:amidase [Shewanella sp. JM162201]|uniref:Amidase n=1 Tax=Shewanella jiangmenensis TaxID=2837387 RepID=A0ABS5V295_9GAMM|nr:amidase [Shewanella jiangmenensis]
MNIFFSGISFFRIPLILGNQPLRVKARYSLQLNYSFQALCLLLALSFGAAANTPAYDFSRADVAGLLEAQRRGELSAEHISEHYLKVIADNNPRYNAVITLANDVKAQAQQLDSARAQGKPMGALHGIPVLIKDNIDTADGMANTAGSVLLAKHFPKADAPLIQKLRAEGAIILGKTNLSEWANFRSSHSVSGWSSLGGQTFNAHDPSRSPCGSSSGSAVAVALGMAPLAIGTETDGSITCPAAMNGVVGIKPSLGLVSQEGIIPISALQDTAGPMARSVADAARLLAVISGEKLNKDDAKLKGLRLGVVANLMGYSPRTDAAFAASLDTLKAAGVTVIEGLELPNLDEMGNLEFQLLLWDFKDAIADYLATTSLPHKNLADLIAANRAAAKTAMPHFGQELFEMSEASKGRTEPEFAKAEARAKELAGKLGIDALINAHSLDALIAPTTGPAWKIDVLNGDHYGGSASSPAAVAGYPHITLPMAQTGDMPLGLSLFSGKGSDARLIAIASAIEPLLHRK